MAAAIHAPGCGVASAARGGSAPPREPQASEVVQQERDRDPRPLSHVTQRPQLTPAARPHERQRHESERGELHDGPGEAHRVIAQEPQEPRAEAAIVEREPVVEEEVREDARLDRERGGDDLVYPEHTREQVKRREVHDHPGRPNQGEPCRASLHRGFPSGAHAVSRAPEGHSRNGA